MKDYSAMSDFDIQQAVLHETWGKHPVRLLGKMMLDIMLSDYDPCNNPADAWPIIQRRGISLNYDGIDWIASDVFTDIKASNNIEEHAGKPMRAAMICYLMALDAEKCDG